MDVVVLARRGLDQLDDKQLASLFQKQWLKLAQNISKVDSSTTQGS